MTASQAYFFRLILQKLDQTNELLKEIPDVFGPFRSPSKYNLRIVVTLKNIYELENLKENLRRKIAITEVVSSIWTNVWFIPENLSILYPRLSISEMNEKTAQPTNPIDKPETDTDETDLQIIRELAKDSRISFRSLAKKLALSTDTVARRYEKLKQKGNIIPRIQIDPAKIGYQATAHFILKLSPQAKATEIISEMIKIPDIFYIMESVGDYNLGAMLFVKNMEQVLSTGELLSRKAGVQRLETTIQRLTEKWPVARTYTSTV